ncbi:MAG: transposase, partial [Microcystis aeruginosa W13-18]|nr:transposase [Microcystis aeruginosa W13-18]
MYRKIEQLPTSPENFEFPSEGQLSPDNRWVIMANLIPWSEFEEEYAQNFSEEMGAPAKSFRMALGALIIKEKLGTSDRETVEQIKENPDLQYFLGLSAYSNEAPFEASMLVHFRARIGVNLINQVNKKMVSNQGELTGFHRGEKSPEKEEKGEEKSEPKNQGKL